MWVALTEEEFQERRCCSIGIGAAALIGGGSALSAGSSLIGSGKSSSAASDAASQSAAASEYAAGIEKQMYEETKQTLSPFVSAGTNALGPMQAIAGSSPAGAPFLAQANQAYQHSTDYQNQASQYLQQAAGMTPPSVMTEADLQNTPGYQFQLGQGLKATQAAAAARGLGVSGASLKGAATYATGLADSNYQNQFNNAQTAWQDVMNQGQSALNLSTSTQNTGAGFLNTGQIAQAMQQQNYNQYSNLANVGENAGAATGQAASSAAGQIGTTTMTGAGQVGNYLTQAGQAQAAGVAGVGNAATSGLNSYLTYNALTGLNNTLANSGTGGWNVQPASAAATQPYSQNQY